MTMTAMIVSPSGILLGLSSLAFYAWSRRKKTKASTTTSSPPATSLPPPPPSPFEPDSGCAVVAGEVEVMRWIKEVVEPILLPRLDSFDVPKIEHELARRAVEEIVDDVYARTVPECTSYQTTATRLVWKALWCEVVMALVERGKLDEEPDDVLRLCMDKSFDPRAPRLEDDDFPVEPLPGPLPMDGTATPRMDDSAEPPSNLAAASSRQELSQLGVMRLFEGTAAGAPIMGPSARLVMLGYNPRWPGLAQARADMRRLAAEHPALAFIEVSFADTQRHFGKPRDVHGMAWALAAAAPDGRVYPTPIARHDARDTPPTAAQWATVIAHASGFVGYGQVRKVVRPRRFGDLVRSLTEGARPSQPRARRTPSTPGRSVPRPSSRKATRARRPAARRSR